MGSRLEIRSLQKAFGSTAVLHDFSLAIAAGEFVSLLGPSGCGKTTTLNIVAGFFDADAGSVALDGADVTRLASHQRGVSMVFQSYALFPHMTVAENIAFGLRMHRIPRHDIAPRVAEMLALVRLPGVADRFPRQLSGGQQQRIGLARALATHPGLLLLDEPLSNLDARLRREMQVELRQILDRVGTTTLYVTHDQEEAMTMSDRIVVMNRGRAEQMGTPREIYCTPRTPFVAELIGESNFVTGIVSAVAPAGAEVSLPSGDHVVARTRGRKVNPGETVLLLSRPSAVTVNPGHGKGLLGTVAARAFAGDHLRLEVLVPAVATFRCETSAADPESFPKGGPVHLVIDDEDWTFVDMPETLS